MRMFSPNRAMSAPVGNFAARPSSLTAFSSKAVSTSLSAISLCSPPVGDPVACQLGPVIRSHWAIENSLHWVMDMVFRDDECRIRTDHAPANFTTLKHMAHNIVRKAPGKDLLRLKRKVAAWDDDFLASLLAA